MKCNVNFLSDRTQVCTIISYKTYAKLKIIIWSKYLLANGKDQDYFYPRIDEGIRVIVVGFDINKKEGKKKKKKELKIREPLVSFVK